ncbi:hypothetical protein IID24_05965 [Patescibacteria group bacterium]|nr:hypothetical protein [Patescibacteria group bacterium]
MRKKAQNVGESDRCIAIPVVVAEQTTEKSPNDITAFPAGIAVVLSYHNLPSLVTTYKTRLHYCPPGTSKTEFTLIIHKLLTNSRAKRLQYNHYLKRLERV